MCKYIVFRLKKQDLHLLSNSTLSRPRELKHTIYLKYTNCGIFSLASKNGFIYLVIKELLRYKYL